MEDGLRDPLLDMLVPKRLLEFTSLLINNRCFSLLYNKFSGVSLIRAKL